MPWSFCTKLWRVSCASLCNLSARAEATAAIVRQAVTKVTVMVFERFAFIICHAPLSSYAATTLQLVKEVTGQWQASGQRIDLQISAIRFVDRSKILQEL